MGFIIVHRGGTSESDYRSYLRVVGRRLLDRGIGYDRVPRTTENGRSDRWLYVSADEADARSIAEELKQTTEDDSWEVRTVQDAASEGPLQPLTIEASKGSTGAGFGLPPLVKKALRLRSPGSVRHKSVWVNTDLARDGLSADDLRELAGQLLPILTGLPFAQLAGFEGFEVIDPATEEVLVPFTPFPECGAASAAATRHSDTAADPDRCTPTHPG